MQRVELRKWSVLSDPDETREAYARIECGGAESCGCEACFNFASTRHLVYSSELLDFFERLGIDPLLEAEACHERCLGGGRHAYTASFYLVGEIDSGPATTIAVAGAERRASLEAADGVTSVGFSSDVREAPEAFRGHCVVRLEVSVVAPWVSNAPEPSGR
ncbi:MAG: hypothetical protein OEM49_00360 [Myxococcales bacterium]|nr:hypothetical protein [Myxococcales bacterium]MDH5305923.1 hypothetical protein [Myxococcales bacterium]MDH5566510.1 hypothetical protein [Myxococcales bacterium]